MRRWDQLAPYNAGQVMRVSGLGDAARWQAAARKVLTDLQLGRPVFDAAEQTVRFSIPRAEDITVTQLAASATWEAHCQVELNRPFAPGAMPVRFFMVPAAPNHDTASPGASHYFGAIYDHWIADSRAMRNLLQRIFEYYASRTPSPPLTLRGGGFADHYRRHLGWWPAAARLRESALSFLRHRRASRINLRDPLDFSAGLIYQQLPAGLIGRVHRWARTQQASVNDVFLATLSQTMGEATAAERYRKGGRLFHPVRRKLALGTIVDIRDLASQSLERVFGVFLSSYTVVLTRPEAQPPERLIEVISRRTRQIKRHYATIRNLAALESVIKWWDRYQSPRGRALFFQKNIPLIAGISNVNMTSSWVDPPPTTISHTAVSATIAAGNPPPPNSFLTGPMVLDYLRISPTGPLLPLVFTLTTIGPRLSLCVTYRTTAFTDEQARALGADFIKRLEQLCP